MFVSMARLLLPDDTAPIDKSATVPTVPGEKKLKIGDRVLAYDLQGKSVKGTVQWVGNHERIPVVGIYAVRKFGGNL